MRPGSRADVSSAPRTGNGEARFVGVSFEGDVNSSGQVCTSKPVRFTLDVDARHDVYVESFAVAINSLSGVKLVNADSAVAGTGCQLRAGSNTIVVTIDSLHLLSGSYSLELWMAQRSGEYLSGDVLDHVHQAGRMEVVSPSREDGRPLPVEGLVPCFCSFQVT